MCSEESPLLSQKTETTHFIMFVVQGQELVILFNGCLDLSANIRIGDMVLFMKYSACPCSISIQRPVSFSLAPS